MENGFKVITLCGSTRFKDEFIKQEKRLTLEGNIVLTVHVFEHSGDKEVLEDGVKDLLSIIHLTQIDMSDEIFVINVGGYIGESTRKEIIYAKEHLTHIEYLENPKYEKNKRYCDSLKLDGKEEPKPVSMGSMVEYLDNPIKVISPDAGNKIQTLSCQVCKNFDMNINCWVGCCGLYPLLADYSMSTAEDYNCEGMTWAERHSEEYTRGLRVKTSPIDDAVPVVMSKELRDMITEAMIKHWPSVEGVLGEVTKELNKS